MSELEVKVISQGWCPGYKSMLEVNVGSQCYNSKLVSGLEVNVGVWWLVGVRVRSQC